MGEGHESLVRSRLFLDGERIWNLVGVIPCENNYPAIKVGFIGWIK